MDTKVNYIVVGLFVILLTLAIIGSAIWLAGVHSTQHYNTYLTYLNEAVTGLSEKASVKFNGVDVGFVDKINLNPTNPQQVRLVLQIDQRIPITEATRASLLSLGITGIAFVGLSAQEVHAPPLKTMPGEKYPVIPSKPSLFFRLDQTVEQMSSSISAVTKNLNDVLNDENKESFKQSLKNLSEITGLIQKNSKEIDEALSSVGRIAKDSEKAAESLRSLAVNGSQSLANFSEQTLPMADQVMSRLKRTLDNLEELTGQLSNNPSMLIRGKNPKTLGPGE